MRHTKTNTITTTKTMLLASSTRCPASKKQAENAIRIRSQQNRTSQQKTHTWAAATNTRRSWNKVDNGIPPRDQKTPDEWLSVASVIWQASCIAAFARVVVCCCHAHDVRRCLAIINEHVAHNRRERPVPKNSSWQPCRSALQVNNQPTKLVFKRQNADVQARYRSKSLPQLPLRVLANIETRSRSSFSRSVIAYGCFLRISYETSLCGKLAQNKVLASISREP